MDATLVYHRHSVRLGADGAALSWLFIKDGGERAYLISGIQITKSRSRSLAVMPMAQM